MCLAMLFFYGLSNVFFYQKVVSIQSDALHGRNISHVIKNDPDFQEKKLVIYNDIQNKPNKFIDFSLLFWDIDEDEIEVLTYNEINNSNSGYLITKRKLSDPLLTYSVRGEAYGIYHLTNTPQNE